MYRSHLIQLQAHFKNTVIDSSAKRRARGSSHALPMTALLLWQLLRKRSPDLQILLSLMGFPFIAPNAQKTTPIRLTVHTGDVQNLPSSLDCSIRAAQTSSLSA